MHYSELITETPDSDRAIRKQALKTLKQQIRLPDTLHVGVLQHTNSRGQTRLYPLAYQTTQFPDLVVSLVADISSPALIQLKLPANKSTLPPAVSYVIAFPVRREYRYPDEPSFESMTEIASQFLAQRQGVLKSDMEKNISNFVHEFIHYWDISRAGKELKPTASHGDMAKYYNAPLERNAYFHEVMLKVDKKPSAFFVQPFPQFLQKTMKLFNREFLTNLSEDNRRRMVSRLYAVWSAKQTQGTVSHEQ